MIKTSKVNRFISITLIFLMTGYSLTSCKSTNSVSSKKKKQPNVIVILSDDQGWGSTSVQMDPNDPHSASDFIKTPHLEKLAKEGMIFSNGYAAHPNCSPTRASVLTGKTPAQLKFTDIIDRHTGPFFEGNKLIPPMHVNGLPDEEITIAELIKTYTPAYQTAHFGKWHLGAGGPEKHGFDTSDGPTGNRHGNKKYKDDPKNIFGITEKGINWMNEQVKNDRPFYLQLSHYATHLGIEASETTLSKKAEEEAGTRHNQINFAAMSEDLDKGVGMIMKEIEKLGIKENTYIIYLSDNGTYPTQNPSNINGPIHGWKATLWEGGIKVPFIIAGPTIEKGYAPASVSSFDILPTVCDWIGIKNIPSDIDGGSLAPIAAKETSRVNRNNDYLLFYFPHYQHKKGTHPGVAIIKDDFKMIKFFEDNQTFLFNLKDDKEELNNLASIHTDKIKELDECITAYFIEHDIQLPQKNEEYRADKDQGLKYSDIKDKIIKEAYFITHSK